MLRFPMHTPGPDDGDAKQGPVAIVAFEKPYVLPYVDLALRLARMDDAPPVLCVPVELEPDQATALDAAGVRVERIDQWRKPDHTRPGLFSILPALARGKRRLARLPFLIPALAGHLIGPLAASLAEESTYLLNVERFLARERVRFLVLPEANVAHSANAWQRAATAGNIDAAVVSMAFHMPYKCSRVLAANARFRPRTRIERLFARLHPAWFKSVDNGPVCRVPVPRAMAMEILSLGVDDPWCIFGHGESSILVDCEFTRDHLAEHGLDRETIHALGGMNEDRMPRTGEERRRVVERAGLETVLDTAQDTGKRLLLTSPPKNYFSCRPSGEYADYGHMLRQWIEPLLRLRGFQVLVSLHPRIAPEHREMVEQLGVPTIPGRVLDLIPLCDLYVGTTSTTLKLARAFGKPVVNYDCYQWEPMTGDSIHYLATRQEYLDFIAGLDDEARVAKIIARAKENTGYWGSLNGGSVQATAAFLRNAAARTANAQARP